MDTNDLRPTGLRERQRRETRAALSRFAIRLCLQRVWENVTVDDIAAAANVSPRTFRNYFPTKAEAVAAGHLEHTLRIADQLRARPVDEELWTAITNP
jgi:AcrR family transcriptional regulator